MKRAIPVILGFVVITIALTWVWEEGGRHLYGRFLKTVAPTIYDWIGFGDAPMITRSRHRSALSACRDALIRATVTSESELAAEDLRLAVRALGRITGSVDVEDLLDIIFRDFCIGK